MPVYEYFCERCQKDVTLAMSISDHERGGAKCPTCGSTELRPQVGTFFSKTSRKS
jgi:putative FmdB family regulatory protein